MKAASDFQAIKMARIARLGLKLEDFDEKFARSSGPGGQNVNKVSTSVTLRHEPSGMVVTVQDSRSQAMNRKLAWERLLDAMEQARRAEKAAIRSEKEKERRRNAPRPYGLKQKILRDKKHRSQVKKMRRPE